MSFLTRTTMFNASRTSARFAPRAFSTSFVARKSATETVADAAKTVDRKVSDVLVDGIEASQNATQKVKEVAGMSSSEMKAEANNVAGQAQSKANELAGDASKATGQAEGTASKLAGQAQGKASEMAGKAKGTAEEIKGKM